MSEMLFIMWVQVINVNNGFVVDQAVKWFQCEGDISSREDGRASGAGWIHFPSLSPDRSDESDWNEIDCANNVTAARHRNDTGWTRLGCARRSAHSNVKDLFVSVRLPHKWNNMTESPSDKMRLLLRMTNQQLNRLMFLTLVMHCNPKAVYQKSVVLHVGLGFFFVCAGIFLHLNMNIIFVDQSLHGIFIWPSGTTAFPFRTEGSQDISHMIHLNFYRRAEYGTAWELQRVTHWEQMGFVGEGVFGGAVNMLVRCT